MKSLVKDMSYPVAVVVEHVPEGLWNILSDRESREVFRRELNEEFYLEFLRDPDRPDNVTIWICRYHYGLKVYVTDLSDDGDGRAQILQYAGGWNAKETLRQVRSFLPDLLDVNEELHRDFSVETLL